MIFEKQNYQQVCINNILTLLQDFDFKSQDNLPECLKRFHVTHPQPIKTLSQSKNVDILMETGTGKTFTYLNLIFALHKTYRQNKFIIFVPRKAILESVKQNIELTKSYFFSEFGAYLKTYYYTDSKSQSAIINHYIKNTDELSVLVLTNSAVDKKDNLLNKQSEGLFNEKSIFENIIALKPICIIDEPHLLKGERFSAAFRQINTLYFRFGATFPKEPKESTLSNVAFVLDSISAFQNYLVKQIAVGSISGVENEIFLKDIRNKEATFVRRKSGELPQYKRVKIGESLEWQNFATLVRLEKGKAYFDNGATIQSQENYKLSNDEISLMLEKAIEAHFQKEQFLFSQNIKALSLFFIPSIADFRAIDSINSTSAHALEASGGGG